ncbi:hypothetical protein Pyn_09683 [Prunus yedoensis var. nudiflora]|uniref:Uncharacterized protein n=1 Tax=Prunus yedoensis var. nudiflora TaxID=2094558 RepID=A0A314XNA5_PRUYE|nr:hypothetical protein Pyn_09683 [Prunus yedoensis var. nudiflora]
MPQACREGHHCLGRRFASSNEMMVSGLSTRHLAFISREPLFCLAKKNCQYKNPDSFAFFFTLKILEFALLKSSLCPPQFSQPSNVLEPFSNSWASSLFVLTCSDAPYCSPSKAKELHLLDLMIWQFGLVQMVPPLLLSTHRPSSWKTDVSQSQDAAEVSPHLRGKMAPPSVKPRRNCNAIDEDGSTQYDDSYSTIFIRPSAPAAYHGRSGSPCAYRVWSEGPCACHVRSDGPCAYHVRSDAPCVYHVRSDGPRVIGDDMGGEDTASG